MRSSRFRYDINALRALAILGVIVFHFNSNWLAGGFSGVDVFFVISGFLMTGIIFRGLEQNNFKLFAFYVARVNRIIPALVFMCMVLLALGIIYLSPFDLASLARSTTYTLSFISNHQYLKETGYFDAASQSKLLLHTWSLSVEWQFYLIYPLALLVLRQILSLASIKKFIVVMTLIGFAIMQYYAHTHLSTAFYALHSRFWQMLVGGLAYCYPIKMPSNLQRTVSVSGIFVIVLSYFLVDQGSWPSLLTLLPVGGAYLVIAANCNHNKLFNHRLSQWLGLRSYSLYLWHWPIVVIAYLYHLPYAPYWGIPLALMLAEGSYRLVEQFHWQTFHRWTDLIKVKPVILALLLIGCGKFIKNPDNTLPLYSNYDERYQNLIKQAQLAIGDWDYPSGLTAATINNVNVHIKSNNADKNALIIGCSHAMHLSPYFVSRNFDYNIYFLAQGSCPIVPTLSMSTNKNCHNVQNYERLLSAMRFNKIIMTGQCVGYELDDNDTAKNKRIAEYDQVFKNFKLHTKNVYWLLADPQHFAFAPIHNLRNGYIKNKISVFDVRRRSVPAKFQSQMRKKMSELNDVTIIEPMQYLCSSGYCKTTDENGRFFYSDSSHFRPWYIKSVGDLYLKEIFND